MRQRRRSSFLTWFSLFFLFAAVLLTILQLVSFSRIRTNFPLGLKIAGVSVGGLDRQEAAERLREAYSVPVEIHYDEEVIQMNPSVVGFTLDIESMLAAADLERVEKPFWEGFWNYLWQRQATPDSVPLSASYSEERLVTYLQAEISPRYDQPATSPQPVVGTVNFIPGLPGTSLVREESVTLIQNALFSNTSRVVRLPLGNTLPPKLGFENLIFFIAQTIDREGFDGLAGGYILDLQTAQEVHFVYQRGEYIETVPDVAFTAASIIKIPIMVSVFNKADGEQDVETANLLRNMIELSGNDPADWVMQRVLDNNLGPLIITEDLKTMGLENTFLAGHFYVGAPLLAAFETPANQRLDINTDPDRYNQTTTSDMGMLLADIYQCAEGGGGALIAVFDGITQDECDLMLNYLSKNQIGVLLEAGTPEGTQVAHKHGWVTDGQGIINTIGDAGIVYSPGGDYVVVLFLYHPVQLIWEPSANLVAEMSRAIYNYFNQTR